MRRMLRILKWLGLGLSTILFVGTGVLWVRSIGHVEAWRFEWFEPRPDWTPPYLAGMGISHSWKARAIHGRLWLRSGTLAPRPKFEAAIDYFRQTITADQAEHSFNLRFEPGERPSNGGTERSSRFAGVGLRRWFDATDPYIGRPGSAGVELALSFWLLTVVFGLWPVCFVARRVLRRKRYAAGLCPSCGYDLRATPDRCPECGRAVVEH